VLDIAKIEAGKLALEIQKVEVSPLFDEVFTLTHVQAAQKGIKLRFEPLPHGSVGARGDFGKVKQVLVNLVGNSLKFTPSGSITVRADPARGPRPLVFEVIDTGIGISQDRQKLIFEKFTQGDGSTTRKYGGTGWGWRSRAAWSSSWAASSASTARARARARACTSRCPVWHEAARGRRRPGDPSDQIGRDGGRAAGAGGRGRSGLAPLPRRLLHKNGYRTVEAANAESGWVLARRLRPAWWCSTTR
jgi:hypothetical protein